MVRRQISDGSIVEMTEEESEAYTKRMAAEYREREQTRNNLREHYRNNLVKAFDALTLSKNDPRLVDKDQKVETMEEVIEAIEKAITARNSLKGT